ncbi:filamentation induced by cAMP protein Fic [Mycolicibacterium novocastrense]|uniref:Filamentation induced by cAMP protein Fic n=1 Tax=Mycolicibacterium novocastrense TaxID=59813 RepID=A0ABQ0KTJ6_MYCNV|nr:filamentation induced by cAMP protein Fic [Mycolicibacterium novocastrense]
MNRPYGFSTPISIGPHGHATQQGYGRLIALLLDTVHQRERDAEQHSERDLQWAQSLRETSARRAGPGGLHL